MKQVGFVRLFYNTVTFVFIALVCRELLPHLETATQHHLRLAVRRILEQQTVIISQSKRLSNLEAIIENTGTKVATMETTSAATIAALVLSEKNNRKEVDDSLKNLEKKMYKEIQGVDGSVNRLQSQLNGVDQRLTRLSQVSAVPVARVGEDQKQSR